MPETVTEPQRALKFIVIILGVLIAISLVVVLVTIAERASGTMNGELKKSNKMVPPLAEPKPGHPVFFGDVRVIIPNGMQTIQASVSGDRLVLLLRDGAGVHRIHVADAASGLYLGTYYLTPQGQAGP